MNHTKTSKILTVLFAVVLCFGPLAWAGPMGTAFTYQGQLIDANKAADGPYDFQFKLYDANTAGNKVAGDVNAPGTDVVDGYFTVLLDFGSVFNGNERWLEIGVRPGEQNDPNVYTTLSPRQEITPTPYAIRTLGSGLSWQEVTGTSQQAASNTGYMANNAGQVSITLPASPNVGDIVRVSGNGVGNWKVTQNAGQSILAGNIVGMGIVMGGSAWTPRENNRGWQSVASSADGRKLVAVVYGGGQIYTSTDFGVSWTARESSRNWYGVASSTDGTKLAAVVIYGQIYTSTDSGVSWTAREGTRAWKSVASSADGTKLAAVVSYGQIYTSTDSGVTWTARESSHAWNSVASSTDGTKLAAVVNYGQIYTSTDSGVTWTARESSRVWNSVASSADGSKMVAVVYGGQIYTSTDSGVSWTQRGSYRNWQSVASSADGSKLVAVVYGGQIYTSKDYGVSWTPCASSQNWQSVASSADASKVVAVVYGGQIYTSIATTTLGPSGYLYGEQGASVELQYVGNGVWIPVSHEDPISAY